MNELKLLDRFDVEVFDNETLYSFVREVKNVFTYTEELEFMTYTERINYIDKHMQDIEQIQKVYARKYPFINTNNLLKVTQKILVTILDFDFLINCVILDNMPLFDRDLHSKLKNIDTWQYLVKCSYNDKAKISEHKESLLRVADVFFNSFIDNLYSINLTNSYNISKKTTEFKRGRHSSTLYKYLDLFEYMDKYTEFIDILEKIKDIVDFEEVRVFVTSYVHIIYKDANIHESEYPNLTPSIMINCIMVMLNNFYESIESSLYSRSPIQIITELMSNLESGELYIDADGISWLTNYEIEMVQTLFLYCIIKDLFDYAFDRIEQILEGQLKVRQLKLSEDRNNRKINDRLYQASIKLIGYTLWNTFNKKVL